MQILGDLQKAFFRASVTLLQSYSVGFCVLPLQKLHGCEKWSKKELGSKKTTALGSINTAIKELTFLKAAEPVF